MPPAARVTDMHVCPMVTGVVPHVGGPILPPCCVTVMTGFMPQARVLDMATCVGPPDMIAMGSLGVTVGMMPAARMGDLCGHGGTIVMGFPQVMIGDIGSGSPVTVSPMEPSAPDAPSQMATQCTAMEEAAVSGAALCPT
jgi:uncharacterized Zn-binding protein involved in type VI secretion